LGNGFCKNIFIIIDGLVAKIDLPIKVRGAFF